MDDRVLLVTGAGGGIGAATARRAAERGYRIVLASRNAERLHALAAELGSPEQVLVHPCDVSEWEEVESLADRIGEVFGRLDVTFANAGQFLAPLLLGDVDAPDEWRSMVLTNVYGTALTVHATWPLLTASQGHLIITGSVAGRIVVPGQLYSATKWAVSGLAQSIRAAAVGTGVRVTVVQPGLVDVGQVPEHRKDDPKLQPGDVARAVMFALDQPPEVDVNEIVVRPTGQAPHR
jgi:NADP-dependent 3-hydroxy acid dehydrogenase YdfG